MDYLLCGYRRRLPEIAQPVVDESERDLHPEIVGWIRDADIAAVGWDVLGAVGRDNRRDYVSSVVVDDRHRNETDASQWCPRHE